jgi:error-prone DNA polymerase
MAARLMVIEGVIQRSREGVVHLMATRIHDRSAELERLTNDFALQPQPSYSDEIAHPQMPRGHGHPRNVRILPRSRDFH